MFKVGDIVVLSEKHKQNVRGLRYGEYLPWYIASLEDEYIVKDIDGSLVVVWMERAKRRCSVYEGFLEKKQQPDCQVTIEQLQQEKDQLESTIEQLKQRLIEAERNALYWTAFDCPVNRDIAERILRKEG